MRLTFAVACAAALLAAGCDSAGPEFDVTNPYDPLFEGTRIASPPAELLLAPSAGASVTIRWADPSSFETGFRVERRSSLFSGGFTPIARLPASATEFTETGITDSQERQYRIVTLADGETNSVPSPVLALRRRRDEVRLAGLGSITTSATGALFSTDGAIGYLFTGSVAYAVDTRSGGINGSLVGAIAPLGSLAGGRIAALRGSSSPSVSVGIYDGATLTGVVTLAPAPDASCPQVLSATLVVSADAQTFAGLCSAPGVDSRTIAVWSGAGGAPARLVVVPGVRAAAVDLSPDGSRMSVVATATTSGGRTASVIDIRSGAVLWSASDSRVAGVPLQFSSDGQRLIDPGPSETRLLVAATGAVAAVQRAVTSLGGTLSFSPDGLSVAVPTGQTGTVAILRLSDLEITNVLRETQTRGFRLLAGDVLIGFRLSASGFDYDITRWDPQAEWEVVPES